MATDVTPTALMPPPRGHSDAVVQGTNDDAQISKLSCARLGYFHDPFIQYFVRKHTQRSPLINRGYYSRTAGLRLLLAQFLSQFQRQCQVLVMGAGYDTTWFQLQEQGLQPTRFIEVDFADVTRRKVAAIQATPQLSQLLDAEACFDPATGALHSRGYHVVPCDLRDLGALEEALSSASWDPLAPTYVLSECVLVYMEPAHSAALVRWFGERCPRAVGVVYEQIHPDDAFGKQMVRNLQSRGCALKGLPATPTLESHCARFTNNGWQRAMARDMDTVYRMHLDPADKARIERLEIFDEFEEWHMIQEHYAITIGINDSQGEFGGFGFPEYAATERAPGGPAPVQGW